MRKPLLVNPKTDSNDLLFEEAPTGVTRCKHCHKIIHLGDIRVTFERYCMSHYFHLHCFTPITHVTIQASKVTTRVYDAGLKEELREWIEDWNKQFKLNQEVVKSVMKKRVKSEAPLHKRAFLESFKYLDLVTLVLGAGQVSKGWYHITWEDEIWRELCQLTFPSVQVTTEFRGAYLKAWFSSCLHCTKELPDPKRHMICPLTSRPKCHKCYRNKENRPQHLSWLKRDYHITEGVLKRSHTQIFDFDGARCAYLYHALPKIGEMRKNLAREIASRENSELDSLYGKECFEVLRSATAEEFYPHNFRTLRLKAGQGSFPLAHMGLFECIEAGKSIRQFEKAVSRAKEEFAHILAA